MVVGLAAVLEVAATLPLAVRVLVEAALGAHGPRVMVLTVLMEVVLVVTVVGGGY